MKEVVRLDGQGLGCQEQSLGLSLAPDIIRAVLSMGGSLRAAGSVFLGENRKTSESFLSTAHKGFLENKESLDRWHAYPLTLLSMNGVTRQGLFR